MREFLGHFVCIDDTEDLWNCLRKGDIYKLYKSNHADNVCVVDYRGDYINYRANRFTDCTAKPLDLKAQPSSKLKQPSLPVEAWARPREGIDYLAINAQFAKRSLSK